MKVLLCGASNYCIIHNHPSGDSSPSADDSKVYDRLKAASEIMNIAIMDSIIVAASDYYSFKENAV